MPAKKENKSRKAHPAMATESAPASSQAKPEIFGYLDFRAYFKDYLAYLRKTKPAFRFQILVEKYGLQSRSHYLDILAGRKLTEKFLASYIAFFGFNGKEADYFQALVGYSQASSPGEKKRFFEAIVHRSPPLETLKMEKEAYTYFSKWHIPVMLAVLDIHNRENDHRKLADQFNPRISAAEAKHALATLVDLGFVAWDGRHGQWRFQRKFLQSTKAAQAAALAGFHASMQQMGIAAYRDDFKNQTFSSLTLSMSLRTKKEIDAMISDLRKSIMDKVKADSDSEVAVQIHFQTFDVSKTRPKAGSHAEKEHDAEPGKPA